MPKGITFKIEDIFHRNLRILLVKKEMKLTKLVDKLLHEWYNENVNKEDRDEI